ncbi:hypothetical protein GCM10010970_39810 [Silvimonas iriomotensis]|uniref:Uncharacterized protein n=1 Tax=Silvimonas iriomotensis TaxID=449662 RepID=A0ABQ2PF22_9NEIS|nr:hypothetical protein GCM10010970_39810 [Silvimonas iriomotensis]
MEKNLQLNPQHFDKSKQALDECRAYRGQFWTPFGENDATSREKPPFGCNMEKRALYTTYNARATT